MGSYEIFARNSEAKTLYIVKLATPSPLTSSITSASSSSSSLLTSINDLTSWELEHRVGNHKDVSSGEEAEDEDFYEDIESTETRKGLENTKNEEITSNSNKTSIQSSPSSLKRRLRDSTSPSEALKLADHVASLNRRMCREREVYLELQKLNETIEEKDEAEASSVVCSISTPSLPPGSPSKDSEAQKKRKMCSSAPETMRLEKQTYEQRLHEFTKDLKKPVIRNFDERRPPKYLQPLRTQSREILRSNAPPLCLTDKKIAELLRRGSMSAREEYLKKLTNVPQKVTGLKKPTGMIIKNLSSGSEEDNCTSEWIIKNSSGSNVTKFANEAKAEANSRTRIEKLIRARISAFPDKIQYQEAKHSAEIEDHRGKEAFDRPQSARSEKSLQKSSNAGTTEIDERIEASDHSHSSRSVKSMQKSLRSSMAELKSVLNNVELKSRDTRPLAVPKLEIQSQEYSQSTSVASREDSTRRALDMNALIRALSDVSIKQQQLVNRKILPVCDFVVSESALPRSLRHASIANGSKQSAIFQENIERQEKNSNYSLPQNCSRASVVTTIKCNERNSNNRSKIPIVVEETHDNVTSKKNHVGWQKNAGKQIVTDFQVPRQERKSKIIPGRTSSTRISSKCQAANSMNSEKHSMKPIKLYSPPMKRNRHSRSPRTSRTNAPSQQGKSSRLSKALRSSDCLSENRGKPGNKNTKSTNGPARILSEPGSSRNDQKIFQDHLLSRKISNAREILPGILKDHPRSSDNKFKYLRRGNQIPCVRSRSSSSSSVIEESELQKKIVKSSASDCHSSDELKIKGKFEIYEDTDEASPRPPLTFPTDELNTKALNPSARGPQFYRDTHKIKLKSPCANVLTEINESRLNSSPENSIHQNNRSREDMPLQESGNFFWADSSSELNRAMDSSFESNQAIESGLRSRLISPRAAVKIKKSSTSSCRSSSKKSSNKSSNATRSSGSPRYRYDENARTVSRNLAAGAFEHFVADAKRKSEKENIFSSTSIIKRLSYSEMKAELTENETSGPERKKSFRELPEASSTEDFIEDSGLNSSQTNLELTGRSDGAVHLFRKAFDRATTRVKVSSSLSKLTRSPEDLRKDSSKLAAGRKSQDRFPFTISESTSGKSSSKCKAEQAIQVASGSKIVEPSETAYRLTAHPSLLRLANAELTTAEIVQTASHDPDIQAPSRRVPRIHRFLGFSWRRFRNEKDKREIKATKILYRNNQCRGGSADESYGSTNASAGKSGRQLDRNGLWVEGLGGEVNPEGDEAKNNSLVNTGDVAGKGQQCEEDRFSIFLAKTESPSSRQFSTKTPMNSLMLEEDPDVDVDPGCLCARFCLFLIGGNVHPRHRSSFPLRNRRSRIRRTF